MAAALVLIGLRVFGPHGAVAPDFTLTDQDGRPYTLSARRGHAVALFFGYAHCPDVCPATLSALARARHNLGAAGSGFDVVFVTVDPERDSPAALKRYVRLFDPSFTGLTGTPAQLEPVYAAYHVVHQIDRGNGTPAQYQVSHSTTVQFIAADGRLRGTGNWSDSPAELVVAMKQTL